MHAPTFDPEMMQLAEISAVMREKDLLNPRRHRDRWTASEEVTILSRRVQYIRNMLQVLLGGDLFVDVAFDLCRVLHVIDQRGIKVLGCEIGKSLKQRLLCMVEPD
jgi:hypothetical protein